MHNEANTTLFDIKNDLTKYMLDNGAEYTGRTCHGGLPCLAWRDHLLAIDSKTWYVGHESVSFFEFLCVITQE